MADNGSGGMTAVVAIVAIIVIVGIGYFVMQSMRGADTGTGDGTSINVDLPGSDAQ